MYFLYGKSYKLELIISYRQLLCNNQLTIVADIFIAFRMGDARYNSTSALKMAADS